jgi:NAD(P)-dependent dehydrogenase (short-subunit alcohol dehydrogenase family)
MGGTAMANRFESKIVIVTGGASGIGRDGAIAFAREGATVVVADIASGEETVKQIHDTGGEAVFVQTDVRKAADVESMVSRCVELYGGLDYAFNNAGISGAFSPLADYDPETWDNVLAVNLTGVFLSMKYEIPALIRRGGGAIVNLASAAGIKSSPDVGPAYNASKHGVVGLSKGAAVQYADKRIRINVVCPGLIRTPLSEQTLLKDESTARTVIGRHPIGRVGEPREVTSLVLWLCSGESSFVTGAIIPVDGGLVLS